MTHPKVMALTTACGAVPMAGAASAQAACGGSYEIGPGNTLYTVSQECRIGLSQIMDFNPDIDPLTMAVG